jgi:DNA-directed RNA polymerase subunit RPC12/RpoP
MKPVAEKKPKLLRRAWKCPACGADLETVFDGKQVQFAYGGKPFAFCTGIYETAEVECPNCRARLEFTKRELESEE